MADDDRSFKAGNKQPGQGVMMKETNVGAHKISFWSIIAFILLIVSWILFLVSFVAAGWVEASRGELTHWVGLWEECHQLFGCKYFTAGELSGKKVDPYRE